jgi:hypothetical protein
MRSRDTHVICEIIRQSASSQYIVYIPRFQRKTSPICIQRCTSSISRKRLGFPRARICAWERHRKFSCRPHPLFSFSYPLLLARRRLSLLSSVAVPACASLAFCLGARPRRLTGRWQDGRLTVSMWSSQRFPLKSKDSL